MINNYLYNKKSKVYLKIENLLNRNNIVNRSGGTSENLGYQSPKLSIYLGVRIQN